MEVEYPPKTVSTGVCWSYTTPPSASNKSSKFPFSCSSLSPVSALLPQTHRSQGAMPPWLLFSPESGWHLPCESCLSVRNHRFSVCPVLFVYLFLRTEGQLSSPLHVGAEIGNILDLFLERQELLFLSWVIAGSCKPCLYEQWQFSTGRHMTTLGDPMTSTPHLRRGGGWGKDLRPFVF